MAMVRAIHAGADGLRRAGDARKYPDQPATNRKGAREAAAGGRADGAGARASAGGAGAGSWRPGVGLRRRRRGCTRGGGGEIPLGKVAPRTIKDHAPTIVLHAPHHSRQNQFGGVIASGRTARLPLATSHDQEQTGASNSPALLRRRVRDHLTELSPAERRLRRIRPRLPRRTRESYTASELASLVNTSNATVTRFFRHLGYTSFDAARRQVPAEQQSGGALLLASSTAKGSEGSAAAHIAQGHRNIDATFNRLPDQVLTEIAAAIVAAREVSIAGYRASQAFASYLRWQIIQVVAQTRTIPGAGETIGEYTRHFAATDCAIVFRSAPDRPTTRRDRRCRHRRRCQGGLHTSQSSRQPLRSRPMADPLRYPGTRSALQPRRRHGGLRPARDQSARGRWCPWTPAYGRHRSGHDSLNELE